jgi:hypothetical protein
MKLAEAQLEKNIIEEVAERVVEVAMKNFYEEGLATEGKVEVDRKAIIMVVQQMVIECLTVD